MKERHFCVLIILTVALSCCKRDNSSSQSVFNEASYPLAVGNWWQYQLTSPGSLSDTFTLMVTSMTTLGSITQYNCDLTGSGGTGPIGYFLQSDTSMSFVNVPNSYFQAFPSFHIKFPVFKGQHWPGDYPPKDTILVNAVVDSCGGYGHNFGPCYYLGESYSLPHNFKVSNMLLTPEIGLIQQSITFNSDTAGVQIQQSITLLNYHVQ